MTETVTRWWWIRHAPVTTDNGCFYGQKDMPADTSNSHVYGPLAQALPNDAVWVASHLQRTHQTAAAIGAAGYSLPAIGHHEDLAEQHFGDCQGVLRAPVYDQYGGMHGFWSTMIDEAPANGESFVDLQRRVDRAVGLLTSAHRGSNIVAVAHGGTIRAAIASALALPPQQALAFTIANCSLTQLDHIEKADGTVRWTVNQLNGLGVQ